MILKEENVKLLLLSSPKESRKDLSIPLYGHCNMVANTLNVVFLDIVIWIKKFFCMPLPISCEVCTSIVL